MRNILFIWIAMALAGKCCSQTLLLSRGGSSPWKIYADASSPMNLQAARVLQNYFERVTGAHLPIDAQKGVGNYFIIGDQNEPGIKNLRNDGFIIATHNGNISITGYRGKSVLYGVYAFIEKYLSCRKWDGGKAYIPHAEQLFVPSVIDEKQEPVLAYREAYFPASFDDEYLDWHGLHRFEDTWGLWGHSFFKLLSPDQYFRTHPEYFSLLDGKRQPVQLCLSNTAVMQIVIAELTKRMADNPSAQYWSVSQNDDIGPCECAQCQKLDVYDGGPQGSLLHFVNAIAARFPGKTITTLSYGYTSRPPLHTRVASNVIVMVSTIDAFRTHPLALEPGAARFRNELHQWTTKCDHLYAWDYRTQFTNYLAPFPIEKNTGADIRYLVAQNITGIFAQGSGDTHSDMSELKAYLLAKQLWDPSLDGDKITREFISGYYGKAAMQVQTLTDEMYANVHNDLDIYGNPVNDYEDYLSPPHMDRYSSLMDEAESRTGNDPVALQHVQRLRLSQEYTYLQQAKFFGKDMHGIYKKNENGVYAPRAGLDKRVQTFIDACEKSGVKQLSEVGGSLSEYAAEWRSILSKPVPVNLAANAPVTLRYPFAPEYPAKKERTLVDETPGYKDFSYNWLCFYRHPMEATIDMLAVKPVHTIRLHFLEDARHWIFHPAAITIELSDDGNTFHPLSTMRIPAPEEEYTIAITPYTFLVNQPARYIRVRAANQPSLPAWRFHKTKKPMIACDEVWVD